MDKDLEDREHEQPTVGLDIALNKYLEEALETVSKVIDLLMAAEEAYTLAKACKPEHSEDWRLRRDGFRAQGTAALKDAEKLLLSGKETSK